MKYNYYLALLLISFSSHGNWQEVPANLYNRAQENKTNIWVTALIQNVGMRVLKSENSKWNNLPGDLKAGQIAIDKDNTTYAVKNLLQPQEAKIFQLNEGTWVPLHNFQENIRNMCVIDKNNIWITKKTSPFNYKAFHWNGKDWQQKGKTNIWEISVGNDDTIIGKQVANYINGNPVELIDKEKVPQDATFSQSSSMVQWNGKEWEAIDTFKDKVVIFLAVIDKNNIWVIKGNSMFDLYPYKWNAKSKEWVKKGNKKSLGLLAMSNDKTIFMLDEEFKIYKWTE